MSALVPALLGVGAGALLAIAVSSWVESFLYAARAIEPAVMLSTGAALLLLALLSGASAARRAARTSPAATLAAD